MHFTARDDGFHFDQMSDRWWETETCWFSFHHAERKLGGWIYMLVRPNIGTVAGGAWVWDHTGSLPWDVLYCANYTSLRLPAGSDLTEIDLPTGVSIKVLEPLARYRIGYHDGDRLQAALEFDAAMAPQPLTTTESSFAHLNHFDQFGRVSGQIVLHGETIDIDCLAMRDRSWGPRPEHRPRRTSYITAIASAESSLFVTTNPVGTEDRVAHGFLMRDGVISSIAQGSRITQRDAQQNWITEVTVTGTDCQGRSFSAVGVPVSRIFINRHTFIDCNSLVRWRFENGDVAWGEDQDIWPVHDWADAVRDAHAGG